MSEKTASKNTQDRAAHSGSEQGLVQRWGVIVNFTYVILFLAAAWMMVATSIAWALVPVALAWVASGIAVGRWRYHMDLAYEAAQEAERERRKREFLGRGLCADCGRQLDHAQGPPEGWQLEDGRTVCGPCCADDLNLMTRRQNERRNRRARSLS